MCHIECDSRHEMEMPAYRLKQIEMAAKNKWSRVCLPYNSHRCETTTNRFYLNANDG